MNQVRMLIDPLETRTLGDLLKQKFGDKLTSMTQQDSSSSSDAESDR